MSFTLENTYPKLSTGKIALLDADYVKYVVCNNIYKDIQKQELTGEAQIFLTERPVIIYTRNWVSEWLMKIEDPILFCFSGKSYNTFRSQLAFDKEYKGNRKKDYTEYPNKMYDMVDAMKYIQDNFTTLIYDDLEADDIVSVLQDENTYIISNDKDLKQVPGFHYNFQTNNLQEITNEQALYNLSYQLIIGDTTDNISGLPGYGEVKAKKFLNQFTPKQYISSVLRLYHSEYGLFKGTDMFTETWMLVKLRENRGANFQKKYCGMFDTKEMILNNIKKDKLKKELV